MKRYGQRHLGFTIVELLIVIVVIAILAAISVVAYNGIQGRAKDASRATGALNILKALEAYKITNGQYPYATPTGPSGSFEQSTDTPGTFMESLKPAYFSEVPVDPDNSGSSFYRYFRYADPQGTYGCPAGKGALMVFFSYGYSSVSNIPRSDPALVCSSRTWGGGSDYLFRYKFENE